MTERRHFVMDKARVEVRDAEGAPQGKVTGRPMVYGDIAEVRTPFFSGRERFAPGALRAPTQGKIVANVDHDASRPLAATPASMTLNFGPDMVTTEFTLPDSPLGVETRAAVKQGVLDRMSIEFVAVKEAVVDGVRVISDAILTGVALVPDGAYTGAVAEARAAQHGKASETHTPSRASYARIAGGLL